MDQKKSNSLPAGKPPVADEWEEVPHAAAPTSGGDEWEEVSADDKFAQEHPVLNVLKKGLDYRDAWSHGLLKGATLGNVDNPFTRANAEKHPVVSGLANVAGNIGTGVATGAGIGSLLKGAGPLARIIGNTAGAAAQGFAAKPSGEDSLGARGKNAGISALIAGPISALGEGVSAASQLGKKAAAKATAFTPNQADAYIGNPGEVHEMADAINSQTGVPALQDKARQAIENSRRMLRSQGLQDASKVSKILDETHGPFPASSTEELSNISPKIAEEVQALHQAKNPPVTAMVQNLNKDRITKLPIGGEFVEQSVQAPLPEKMEAPLSLLQNAKRAAQDQAQFGPTTITDPVAVSRVKSMGTQAYNLRKRIEDAAPAVAPLNARQQESLLLQKALRQGQKNPLSFVSTESPDRMASLARAENRGAGGLLDFGNKYGAAKMLAKKDIDDPISRMLLGLGGRAALRNVPFDAVENASKSPEAVQSLISILQGNKKK